MIDFNATIETRSTRELAMSVVKLLKGANRDTAETICTRIYRVNYSIFTEMCDICECYREVPELSKKLSEMMPSPSFRSHLSHRRYAK